MYNEKMQRYYKGTGEVLGEGTHGLRVGKTHTGKRKHNSLEKCQSTARGETEALREGNGYSQRGDEYCEACVLLR